MRSNMRSMNCCDRRFFSDSTDVAPIHEENIALPERTRATHPQHRDPSTSGQGQARHPISRHGRENPMNQSAATGQHYLEGLEEWAAAGGVEDGDRRTAANEIKKWLDAGWQDSPLHLDGLQLTSLPPLPESVKALYIDNNKLSALDGLPSQLEFVSANDNQLCSLPETLPPTLRELYVMQNRLEVLPEMVGASIWKIDASFNQLRSLPKTLPPSLWKLDIVSNALEVLPEMQAKSLKFIDASHNELHSLPETLPASLRQLDVSHNKLTAMSKMRCDSIAFINANSNHLSSLPENLPPSLEILHIAHNELEVLLPATLPASLIELDVSDNKLTSLPEIWGNSIRFIDASYNDLRSLPATLPATLEGLDVSVNNLRFLPEIRGESIVTIKADYNHLHSVPAIVSESLRYLDVSHNSITSLPESITGLPDILEINLENNLLSEQTVANLQGAMAAEDYAGPTIYFDMASAEYFDNEPLPLRELVPQWYEDERKPDVSQKWAGFDNEPCAADFSRFLKSLSNTAGATHAEFQKGVGEELDKMASAPELRKSCFAASFDATASCVDRVSHTRNQITKLCLESDIRNEKYDNSLPELFTLLRGLFRLDILMRIADEKVRTLRFVDEIEVYMAYQVKLRSVLKLPLNTPEMQFFGVSGVTDEDLRHARTRVVNEERENFLKHLIKSDAWANVLSRLAPDAYKKAKETCADAVSDPDILQKRIAERMKELGSANLGDEAEKQVGKQVADDIEVEIMGKFTQEFLASKQLAGLLKSPWEVETQ